MQGSVMKATLFEDNIAAYDTIIIQNQEYIISNATIKPVDPKYQTRENEYQMTINTRTIIQPTLQCTMYIAKKELCRLILWTTNDIMWYSKTKTTFISCVRHSVFTECKVRTRTNTFSGNQTLCHPFVMYGG